MYAPKDLLRESGFGEVREAAEWPLNKPIEPIVGRYAGIWRSDGRRAELRIDSEQRTRVDEVFDNPRMMFNATPPSASTQAPSARPIGRFVMFTTSDRSFGVSVTTNHELVKLRLSPVQDSSKLQELDASEPRWEGNGALLEAVARGCIALGVGRRAEPGASVIRGVRQFSCAHSESSWFDLDDWAVARGWAVSESDAVPSVTLTKDGRTVLLPLAAMQAKVDGTWRELGDCVAEKDGRWLVPATIDEIAG